MRVELLGGPCDGEMRDMDTCRYRCLLVHLPSRRVVMSASELREPYNGTLRHARYVFDGNALQFTGEYGRE